MHGFVTKSFCAVVACFTLLLINIVLADDPPIDPKEAPEKPITRRWATVYKPTRFDNTAARFERNLNLLDSGHLAFHGPGEVPGELDGNLMEAYRATGAFNVIDGVLQPKNKEQAAIHVATTEDFELEGRIGAEGVGGWFVMVGWNGDQGYILYNVTLVKSVDWRIYEVGGEKYIGHVTNLEPYKWPGEQDFRLVMDDKKLSFRVGNTTLANEIELPNYGEGHIFIGTANTQYGPKPLKIRSLRIRALE